MRLNDPEPGDDAQGPDALTETDGIYIEWEVDAQPNLDGYHIYRAATDATAKYDRIGITAATVTFYEDTPLRLETRYCYRVTAVDLEGNESPMSEAACYTLMRKPSLTSPPNHAVLDTMPTFRWLPIGEAGFYTVRVFVETGLSEPQELHELWRYETADFDRLEATYNQDGGATEPLIPGQRYRWRVDFEERATVGSESTWRFFTMRP